MSRGKGATGQPRYGVGVAWSAINAAAGVLLPFVLFIFFARHLSPADVGIVMLASAIAEIIKAFGLPGLYEALLQQSRETRVFHETALAVLLVAGVGLLIVYIAVITVLGDFMPGVGAHRLVLDLLGLRILCDLATIQPQAALAQSLAYGRLAVRSIMANLGAGAIGVALTLYGQPFTALAAYLAGQSVLIFLTTAIGSGILVRPRFVRANMAAMTREAFAASVVRLVAAINNYLDQIILASSIGSLVLAYFNLAKRVEMTFITAASSFSGILFQPTFSARASDARCIALRRGLAVLGFICGVPCVFFIVNANSVVTLAFGPDWVPAAAVAAVLAASGFIRALGSVHGALLSVSGHNRQLMWVTGVSAASGIAVVVAGAPFGLIAVAIGLAFKNATIVVWMARLTRGSLPNPLITYLLGIVLPVIVMLVASMGVATLVRHNCPSDMAVLAASAFATAVSGLICFGPTIVPLYRYRGRMTDPSPSPVTSVLT
jgi:teichuronic acid exporter